MYEGPAHCMVMGWGGWVYERRQGGEGGCMNGGRVGRVGV